MPVMERFDDVSVVASVDESPPPPRVSRRTKRAFTAVVATIVATGALAGAAVGLADEKAEPSGSSAAPSAERWSKDSGRGHDCPFRHSRQSSSSLRY
jgi:hypothetical protein